jgi:hypothetical protein
VHGVSVFVGASVSGEGNRLMAEGTGQFKSGRTFHETPPELSEETQENQIKIIGTKGEHFQVKNCKLARVTEATQQQPSTPAIHS